MAKNSTKENQKENPKQMNAPSSKPAVGAHNSRKTSVYRTQGIITSISLMDKTFTIEPISPYVFELKKGDGTEKNTLFVLAEDKDSAFKEAKILTGRQDYEIPKKIDLGAIIALKNVREKIELEAELNVGLIEGRDKLKVKVKSLSTLKA